MGEYSKICVRVVLLKKLADADITYLPQLEQALQEYERSRSVFFQ
jgi:hypothetical protein